MKYDTERILGNWRESFEDWKEIGRQAAEERKYREAGKRFFKRMFMLPLVALLVLTASMAYQMFKENRIKNNLSENSVYFGNTRRIYSKSDEDLNSQIIYKGRIYSFTHDDNDSLLVDYICKTTEKPKELRRKGGRYLIKR